MELSDTFVGVADEDEDTITVVRCIAKRHLNEEGITLRLDYMRGKEAHFGPETDFCAEMVTAHAKRLVIENPNAFVIAELPEKALDPEFMIKDENMAAAVRKSAEPKKRAVFEPDVDGLPDYDEAMKFEAEPEKNTRKKAKKAPAEEPPEKE